MSTNPARPADHPAAPNVAATRVAFVGAGPGDPGLLTLRAREYLAAADVVLLDSLHDAEFIQRFTREDAAVVDAAHGSSGQVLTRASRAKLLVRTVNKRAPETGLVVRLMDGDPSTFGGLVAEANALRGAGVAFEIVPGVSSAWSVPAYAGVPLTADDSGEVHVIDGSDAHTDWAHSATDDVTVVILGDHTGMRRALTGLQKAGRDPHTPVCLTQNGTTVSQQSTVTTLEQALDVLAQDCPEASVAVVGNQVGMRESLSWFETKPLFGWQVLVPRTKDQAEPMVSRIESFGATASVVPTISVEPPRTPQQMDRAIRGLVTGRYEWIGFTSVNAVRAVREKFDELGLDARAFAGLKIAAVGGVTAESLRSWGLEPDLVPDEEQSAQGLLDVWPPFDDVLDPINRVFLPRADIATDTLVAGLQDMGWEVDDVTAYRTVRAAPPAASVREAIKGGVFDAVCFTSSSTVRNLVGIAGKPHVNTVVACIGPATAKTAEEHGLRVDVVAPEASSIAVVDALAQHAAQVALDRQEAGEPVLRPSQRRASGRRAARARS